MDDGHDEQLCKGTDRVGSAQARETRRVSFISIDAETSDRFHAAYDEATDTLPGTVSTADDSTLPPLIRGALITR